MLRDIDGLQGSASLGSSSLVLVGRRQIETFLNEPSRYPAPGAQLVAKRAIDVAASLLLLIVLAPLLLLISALVLAVDRMPAFYGQERYGRDGRSFRILKFRTMRCDESGRDFVQVTPGDERVTQLGAFLRRSSLDELPQLINVLVGEMSLVGPRPHALAMEEQNFTTYPRSVRRLQMRPGMTGLAQIRGLRGPTASFDDLRARLDADVAYVENWTLGRDLAILCATPAAWLLGKNAC